MQPLMEWEESTVMKSLIARRTAHPGVVIRHVLVVAALMLGMAGFSSPASANPETLAAAVSGGSIQGAPWGSAWYNWGTWSVNDAVLDLAGTWGGNPVAAEYLCDGSGGAGGNGSFYGSFNCSKGPGFLPEGPGPENLSFNWDNGVSFPFAPPPGASAVTIDATATDGVTNAEMSCAGAIYSWQPVGSGQGFFMSCLLGDEDFPPDPGPIPTPSPGPPTVTRCNDEPAPGDVWVDVQFGGTRYGFVGADTGDKTVCVFDESAGIVPEDPDPTKTGVAIRIIKCPAAPAEPCTEVLATTGAEVGAVDPEPTTNPVGAIVSAGGTCLWIDGEQVLPDCDAPETASAGASVAQGDAPGVTQSGLGAKVTFGQDAGETVTVYMSDERVTGYNLAPGCVAVNVNC